MSACACQVRMQAMLHVNITCSTAVSILCIYIYKVAMARCAYSLARLAANTKTTLTNVDDGE